MNISTDAIVLRVQKIGERDRLCTLLAGKLGVVRAFAKGAQSLKHKCFAATMQFAYSRFELYSGRDRYLIDEAQCEDTNYAIRTDPDKLALGQYLCELTMNLAAQEEASPDYLHLLRTALYYLAHDKRPIEVIKSATEMRELAWAGYMPDLLMCDKCGAYEAQQMFFLPASGKLRCGDCGVPEFEDSVELACGSLTALRHTVYADVNKNYSFTLPAQGLAKLSEASEKYLLLQTGCDYKTLEFYHMLKSAGNAQRNENDDK